jgi:hypothetical protein
MTYYLITDMGTQWFHYLVSKDGEKIVDVHDMSPINRADSTLLSNIYGREPVHGLPDFHDGRLINGGGMFGGWSISELEFGRIKRMLELAPAVSEFNKIKDSV